MAQLIDSREIERLTATSQPSPQVRSFARRAARLSSRPDLLCWAVILIGFVSVWRFNLVFLRQFPFLRLGIATMAFGLVAWFMTGDPLRRWRNIERLPAARLIFGILVIAAFGIPFGIYPGKAFDFVRTDYLSLVIFFVLTVASIRSRVDLERLMLMHVLGATVYSLDALRASVGPDGRLSHLTVYDANDYGVLLVSTLPIAVYFLRTNAKAVVRVIASLAVVLFVVQLVRTGSRGGFLGLLGVGGYLLVRFQGIPARIRVAAATIGLVTIAVAGTDTYWSMMASIRDPSQDYNVTEAGGRLQIWKRGIGYMVGHPVFGVGLNNFGVAEGNSDLSRMRVEQGSGWIQKASHNSFIQIGAEAGLVGLGLFLSLTAISFRSCSWRMRQRPTRSEQDEQAMGRALAGALVGFCVAGFFVSGAYSTFLYAIFGLIAGLEKIRRLRPLQGPSNAPAPRTPHHRPVPVPIALPATSSI